MISGIKPTELLFRDGTSQSERLNTFLDPEIIPVDERTTEDLIRFAQEFAQQLRFFDDDNNVSGNWEAFFIDDYTAYRAMPEGKEKEAHRERWIEDLMDYIERPETYADDQSAADSFGRPHLALFVTFLQLLGIVRTQMNGFTKRHLDFYYRQVLRLDPKKQVPDTVYVIVDLAEGVNAYLLKKGTLLSAGKDGLGKELMYETEQDTMIGRAKVTDLRNVFADKKITGIRQAREAAAKDPDAGLMPMLKIALGSPSPGDELPPYKNTALSLDTLKTDLDNDVAAAIDYVTKSLFLTKENFNFLLSLKSNSLDEQWENAYATLNQAYKDKLSAATRTQLQQKREEPSENGFMAMLKYALGDPDAGDPLPEYNGDETTVAQLTLFAERIAGTDDKLHANAGAYVKSALQMTEAEFLKCMDVYTDETPKADWDAVYRIIEKARARKLNLVLPSPVTEEYVNIFAIADAASGAFTLSGEEGASKRFNTFGKGATKAELQTAVAARIGIAVSSPQLLLREGKRKISVSFLFRNPGSDQLVALYNRQRPFLQFYLSSSDSWIMAEPVKLEFSLAESADGKKTVVLALKADLVLSENDAPVLPTAMNNNFRYFASEVPILALVMDNEAGRKPTIPYVLLKDLQISKVNVTVEADQLQELMLQNDDAVINPKKPFEPFGFRPVTGSSFYFTHPELSTKKLDSLTLHFEWMKPPSDLGKYYENYIKIDAGDGGAVNTKLVNSAFKAKLSMREDSIYADLDTPGLFDAADAKKIFNATIDVAGKLKNAGFTYARIRQEPPKYLFDWKRYFRLELADPDFQHEAYPVLLTRQAYMPKEKEVLKTLFLNPPYTPKLKSLTAGYTASFEIDARTTGTANGIFHIHPFGYSTLNLAGTSEKPANAPLLPDYTNEGELYIGISDLAVSQQLPLLFKMAEGSANPDIPKPDVSWSYLAADEWKPFPPGTFISDTTNGLVNTGIITVVLPEDATTDHHLMPAGRNWIRARVEANSAAITDTVAILAQSVQAVFTDKENDPQHLLTLLSPESIKAPVPKIPEIKKLEQPFSSSKGRPAEAGTFFYNRVSERLRHKNRAVTMWDYERIILDRFPEIHKVKCVPADFSGSAESYGKVDLIVIPDIKGKLPFNPYQPKVSSDTLEEVRQYINQRVPAFAEVHVKNASFLQVKTRFAVKFKEKGNEPYYVNELENELKRYLSPWAFDDGADIVIGGKIYASMIVNFIAERPYVDYVAGIKLFRSMDGLHFTEADVTTEGEMSIQADHPDIILVSAQAHELDLVTDKGFVEKDFAGIDFMKVELDFTVAPSSKA